MSVGHSMLSKAICAAAIAGIGGMVAAMPQAMAEPIRVGVLSFGTAQWEMNTIKHHKLAEAEGLELEVVGLGDKLTHAIALENQAANIVMTDYFWVSAQRAEGADYTFVPHSKVAGGVVARPDSGIMSLADLRGKKFGMIGGPSEDNWLFLRAYTRKEFGWDIADEASEVKFVGAPPLLNESVKNGEIDAVMNFWHYNARLRSEGYIDLVSLPEIYQALGVEFQPPILGWVFSETWANDNADTATAFFRASLAAKRLLLTSDAEWERLKPAMRAEENEPMFLALRDAYREGIATAFGQREIDAAEQVFQVIRREGGEDVVGGATSLSPGTFWTGFSF